MTEKGTLIGNRISEIRKKAGFSQDELAKITGYNRSTISNIERNDQKPSIEFLMQFATLTNVSLDEIVGVPTKNEGQKVINVIDQLDRLKEESDLSIRYELVNAIKNHLNQLETDNRIINDKYLASLEELKAIQEKLITLFAERPKKK